MEGLAFSRVIEIAFMVIIEILSTVYHIVDIRVKLFLQMTIATSIDSYPFGFPS